MAGIVHVPGSTLTRVASDIVLSAGGPSVVPVMTKTFSATLVATELLLLELLGGSARERGGRRDPRRRRRGRGRPSPPPSPLAEPLAASLRDARHLFVTGGGVAYPAALEAALKLKEMALVHAEGAEVWEMTSGAATMLGPDAVVIALAPEGPARPAVADLLAHAAEWGARTIEVGPAALVGTSTLLPLPADAHEDHAPLCAVPPVALVAFALARLRGRQPGPPRLDRAVPQPGPAPHPGRRRGGRPVTRIVLVGAGSVEFTRNLLGDILSFEALRDAELVLHDIDADRLATAQRMAEWTAGALGATPSIATHLDRRTALEGADYVIDTIQVGGARATQIDFDIPGRYGLQYTINDTINVGGVLRGLRTIPVVLGIAADMADVCPDALFLNYTNPMGMLVRAVDEAVGFPTVGLCHSVYWTVHRLAEYVGVPFEEVDSLSGGVNHLAWILRLEHRGRDLYPDVQAFVDAGRVPDDDLVRADLYRRFGWYPTESSEHHAEYNPWFIPKGQVEPFHVPIGEYLSRVAHNLDEYADTKRMLDAGEAFEIERSGEYASVIINAIATGEPATDRRQRDERRRGDDHQPRQGRVHRGPRARRRARRPPDPDRRPAAPVRRLHPPGRRLPGAHRAGGPRRGPRPRLPRRHDRPDRPGPPHARRGLAHDRRAHRRRGGVAPRLARRLGTRLDLVNDWRRPTMLATPIVPRRRGIALLAALLAIVVAACGGTTTPARVAPRRGATPAAATPAPAASGPAGASAEAPSAAGYTGPPVTIKYSIWGDPQEITSQKAIADAFHVANPNITVDVDVSDWDAYWTKLQTGLAGGAAPDVFAMDGPLFPDYQARDVLLDLKPYIDKRRL